MTQLRADVARFLNDRLDWNLLRTYLVIMQERSVSRAAARLHLTQPAVSQALKRLEDTLGRRLIERRGPHFEPTRAGEEVYRIASDIYGHMSRLETELDDRTDDITGSIRLLSVSRIDSAVYDEFLAEFHGAGQRLVRVAVSFLFQSEQSEIGLCDGKLHRANRTRLSQAAHCPRHGLIGQGELAVLHQDQPPLAPYRRHPGMIRSELLLIERPGFAVQR